MSNQTPKFSRGRWYATGSHILCEATVIAYFVQSGPGTLNTPSEDLEQQDRANARLASFAPELAEMLVRLGKEVTDKAGMFLPESTLKMLVDAGRLVLHATTG